MNFASLAASDTQNPTAIIVAILALAGAVVTPIVSHLLGRRRNNRTEGRLDWDEMQEDIGAVRLELRKYKADAGAEIAWLNECLRIVDDEVIELRAGISERRIPPLPPRKPWPQRPVVNTGGA